VICCCYAIFVICDIVYLFRSDVQADDTARQAVDKSFGSSSSSSLSVRYVVWMMLEFIAYIAYTAHFHHVSSL